MIKGCNKKKTQIETPLQYYVIQYTHSPMNLHSSRLSIRANRENTYSENLINSSSFNIPETFKTNALY